MQIYKNPALQGGRDSAVTLTHTKETGKGNISTYCCIQLLGKESYGKKEDFFWDYIIVFK